MVSLKDKFTNLSKFPRVFWIVQTFEMMERGAYYTMVPILVVHAYFNVGVPLEIAGILFAFMYPFQYGLPIFTGALAEKIGYRKQMIFAFSFLTVAYIFLFLAYSTITMILAVISVGIGIGSYKPLVSSTIAKCTSSEDRNLAYSIYYWIVNLAASLFPIIFVVFEVAGFLPQSSYRIVFLVGGIMVSLNILTGIFVFQEVPRSGKVKTVKDAINNIKLAMSDKKFLVMVVLIGGFWAQYATMLFAIQLIGFGYRWFPAFITAMVLGIPNPLTIILLGPFISKFIEKIESMRVILGGLTVYIMGLMIIGFFLQTWQLIIVGIIICSIGEFMVAPGYMAFVSKLAPKDNVSAYIGCNFISYMIGLFGGTLVFGLIVAYIAETLQMPYLFYGILISFALVLMFAFITYYKTWGKDVIERARKIRELEEGKDITPTMQDEKKEPFIFRLYETKIAGIAPLILVPIVIFASLSFGTFDYIGRDEDDEGSGPKLTDWSRWTVTDGGPLTSSGQLQEGASTVETISVGENNVLSIKFTLTWTDEPDQQYGPRTYYNEPDTFSIQAQAPDGTESRSETGSNPQGGSGEISVTINFSPDKDPYLNGTGSYNVTIELIECGDFFSNGPIGFTDTENSWELAVEYEYYGKTE
jgi:MFS family permease